MFKCGRTGVKRKPYEGQQGSERERTGAKLEPFGDQQASGMTRFFCGDRRNSLRSAFFLWGRVFFLQGVNGNRTKGAKGAEKRRHMLV